MQKVIAIVWTFQKEEHGFPLTMTGSWSGNMCYKRWKNKGLEKWNRSCVTYMKTGIWAYDYRLILSQILTRKSYYDYSEERKIINVTVNHIKVAKLVTLLSLSSQMRHF